MPLTEGPVTLVLDSDAHMTLARMLKLALGLPTGTDAADHLPVNPWGDMDNFRRAVYIPLHGGGPSTPSSMAGAQEVVIEPGNVAPIRDVLDRLARNFSSGSEWTAPSALERGAIEPALARMSDPT